MPVLPGPAAVHMLGMNMNKPFPTYAKTSDPAVAEALRKTYADYNEFLEKCRDVSEKYTGQRGASYLNGHPLSGVYFAGISAKNVEDLSALPGRWKQPKGDAILPFKNNPAMADFDIEHRATTIPGRKNLVVGIGMMGTGAMFEHEGSTYSHFSFAMEPMSDRWAAESKKHGWQEIPASEFYTAAEAYEASIRSEQADG